MYITPLLLQAAKVRADAAEARERARVAGGTEMHRLVDYAAALEHRADELSAVADRAVDDLLSARGHLTGAP